LEKEYASNIIIPETEPRLVRNIYRRAFQTRKKSEKRHVHYHELERTINNSQKKKEDLLQEQKKHTVMLIMQQIMKVKNKREKSVEVGKKYSDIMEKVFLF
jgi:hypothetical protein